MSLQVRLGALITAIGADIKAATLHGIIVCTSSTRPTSNLFDGMMIYETDTKRKLRYNGTSWFIESDDATALTSYTSTTTNLTSGAATGYWRYINSKLIYITVVVTAGTVNVAGTQFTFTLPSGLSVDAAVTPQLAARFNANKPLNSYASSTTIKLSPTDAAGTNLTAGTSMVNVTMSGTLPLA